MRLALWTASFAGLAMTASAQSADWQAEVDSVLDAFSQAVAAENILPFLLPLEHPDVIAAGADYLGTTPEMYVQIALEGYAYSREQSDIKEFEVFDARAAHGVIGAIPWTIISYSIDIDTSGMILPVLCNRLLIRREDGQLYVTMVPEGSTASVILGALPLYAGPLENHPADCSE